MIQGGEAVAQAQSLTQMIIESPIEAQVVLALCAIASVASWYIIGAKWWEFRGLKAREGEYLRSTTRAKTLEAREQAIAHLTQSPFTTLIRAASEFMSDLRNAMTRDNVQRSGLSLTQLEALSLTLDADVRSSAEHAGRMLPWLATIGSTAPLLGLFGTVLGIIRAFKEIAASNQSSLQSVGPGIAEALIATAAGLLAAIPAVMAYNIFTARREQMEGVLERAAQELIGALGRDGKL